jgi:hypothetical protein
MKSKYFAAVVALTGGLVFGAAAVQDKSTVRVPQGLAFSDFKGYESWQAVAVSHPAGEGAEMSGEALNVILANPVMVDAYAAGHPGNGKPWPDGAMTVKIQYIPKKSKEAPFNVAIPDRLRNVAFMVKDSKRFAAGGGWAYANFNYDAASKTFTPDGTGTECGVACHTIVKGKDYVFTEYGAR